MSENDPTTDPLADFNLDGIDFGIGDPDAIQTRPVHINLSLLSDSADAEEVDHELDQGLNDKPNVKPPAKPHSDKRCELNPLPLEWPDGLYHFKGSPRWWMGLDVYYDFSWSEKVPHNQERFLRCQTLATFAKKNGKPDKSPAILLTQREHPKPILKKTDSHIILVVSIDGYLTLKPQSAEAYFFSCHSVDPEVVQEYSNNPDLFTEVLKQNPDILKQFLSQDQDLLRRLLGQDPGLLEQIVNDNLGKTNIAIWAKQNSDRLEDLQTILDENRTGSDRTKKALDQLLKQWAIGGVDDADIVSLVKVMTDTSQLSCIIKALADKTDELSKLKPLGHDDGNRMVAAALRTAHRTPALNRLVTFIEQDVLEKQFQRLFDANWWMLGRHYVKRIENRELAARTQIDILLQSADNYYDLFELKRSKTEIFKPYDEDRTVLVLRSEVNDAVTQTIQYIYTLERHLEINRSPPVNLDLLRLNTYVVIGFIADDDPERQAKRLALRLYNSHLHRIKVVTYDEIVRIAQQVISSNKGEMEAALQLETEFEKEDQEQAKADQQLAPDR
jgi:hypothetical protein